MQGRNTTLARLAAACATAIVALAVALPGVAAAQSISMDELRAKLKEGKKKIVAANMTLTPSEEAAFWPIYDEYQTKLTTLNQNYGQIIDSYATAYNAGPMRVQRAGGIPRIRETQAYVAAIMARLSEPVRR